MLRAHHHNMYRGELLYELFDGKSTGVLEKPPIQRQTLETENVYQVAHEKTCPMARACTSARRKDTCLK